MRSKKVVLVKDEMPFVFVVDAEQPWTIDPKMDPRNKIVDIPELLWQDYEITVDLLDRLRERLMKYYAK